MNNCLKSDKYYLNFTNEKTIESLSTNKTITKEEFKQSKSSFLENLEKFYKNYLELNRNQTKIEEFKQNIIQIKELFNSNQEKNGIFEQRFNEINSNINENINSILNNWEIIHDSNFSNEILENYILNYLFDKKINNESSFNHKKNLIQNKLNQIKKTSIFKKIIFLYKSNSHHRSPYDIIEFGSHKDEIRLLIYNKKNEYEIYLYLLTEHKEYEKFLHDFHKEK